MNEPFDGHNPSQQRYSREFPPLPGQDPLRFGIGAIAGALLGFFWALGRRPPDTLAGLCLRVVVVAVLFGILSATLGEGFWRRSLWWWTALAIAAAAATVLWVR